MLKPHIYDHETPAYIAHLAQVDTFEAPELRKILKFIVDDLWGDGDGEPGSPRRLNRDKEWNGETAYEISQSLNGAPCTLQPPDACDCGNPIDDGEGYDGMCGECADRAEARS